MESQAYTLAELEIQVKENNQNMKRWLSSQVKSQKEFFIYTKQAVWLATQYHNFLPLQDIQQYLDNIADLTGDVVNYAKQFKKLVSMISGGVVNIDGVAMYDKKKAMLVYSKGKYTLQNGAAWADISSCISALPKTTMKILAFMKMPSVPARPSVQWARINLTDLSTWLDKIEDGMNKDNMDMIAEVYDKLLDLYNKSV